MTPTVDGMDLAALIERMKGDRSYAQLADECGGSPGRQRWQQMATSQSLANFPDPATVRAIASTLGVSQRTVVLAAARSAGLTVEEGAGLAALLPPSAAALTDRQVAAVLAVVRAMLEPFDGAPTKQPAPNAETAEAIRNHLAALAEGAERATENRAGRKRQS